MKVGIVGGSIAGCTAAVELERAFVWNAPDFSMMTESEARAWWMASITFPDDFSYVAAHQE